MDNYINGFGGDLQKGHDYWLGLENLHKLTNLKSTKTELRVYMEDKGTNVFAKYQKFYIGDKSTKYTLHVENY